MNDFDQGSRAAVKEDAAGTIRWLFPRMKPSLRWNRWLDAQSTPRPGEPDRRCDTIAELVDDEGTSSPWACVIELFTGADPEALDRAVEYLGRFRRELRHGPYGHDKYPFAFALVFLTGAPGLTRLDMNLPGMEEVGLWFGPRIVDLSREDAVAHLEAIAQNRLARGLLCWASLMRGGHTAEFIANWRVVVESDPDEQRRKTQVDLAILFAELTDCRPLWKSCLEGLLMNESISMREVRTQNTLTLTREYTIELLEAKFPGEVTPDILEHIRTQNDIATLKRWLKLAGTAGDFGSFVRDCS